MPKNHKKLTNLFAYTLLALFLSLFLIASLLDSSLHTAPFLGIAILFFIIGLKKEKGLVLERRWTIRKDFTVTLAALAGAVLTFILSTRIDLGAGLLGPALAASGTALIYGFLATFFPAYKDSSAPFYCGTFVGMSSILVLPNIWLVAGAGTLSGIIFCLSHDVFLGTGGKLGTIAFISVVVTKLAAYAITGAW